MLHPVGDLSPSVYWRRRIVLVAAVVLVGLSMYALLRHGGGNGTPAASGQTTSGSNSSHSSTLPTTTTPASSSSTVGQGPSQSTASAAPLACKPSQLTVSAKTDGASYKVGATPVLSIVVINQGPKPCVTGLADKEIELRVYSGSARVWGSHDCQVQPGTNAATLPVGRPTQRDISWSGLSSQPGCTSARQRVPAGTYVLHAYLSGGTGKTAVFTFTG
ncbi:hypothetical protein M6D93_02790 [Jatrophihabitans telluris]|uniref:Intracellular proteinase inhibitor BsuPI domain-containing protein n=1 Tax=Jatrophihabitans telluris TaxID=2038343 RepID=A0ABY4QZQ0_9ACTN|nr:hypothetical protein [Jatrophihabitans telluris]UQX88934.1 hypothetical protein M6D93_02790 [Jatrophihabitans telluris]